jgi:DNA polymerase III alpha subunit (gram-positive type)
MILAFVDTETTGLKPGVNRVIEAALQTVEVTWSGIKPITTLVMRQRVNLSTTPWSPEAFRVNGYEEEHPDWKDAPLVGSSEAQSRWRYFNDLVSGHCLCSQNVGFDRDFLAAELAYFGMEPRWDRRTVDIQALSALAAIKLGLPKFGLHQIYDALGGPKLQEHRALADIERGKFVFEKVAGAFFAA